MWEIEDGVDSDYDEVPFMSCHLYAVQPLQIVSSYVCVVCVNADFVIGAG
jgi:hypothetical protein